MLTRVFPSEILKDVVPPQLIKLDPRRFLEGSRLLFGLILEKAKHVMLKEEGAKLPYLSSLSVIDLRNTFTMETVVNPVGTSVVSKLDSRYFLFALVSY